MQGYFYYPYTYGVWIMGKVDGILHTVNGHVT